jgi:hypothetical protein
VLWVSGLLVTSIALTRQTQETHRRQALAQLEWIFMRGLADVGAAHDSRRHQLGDPDEQTWPTRTPWLHIKLSLCCC